MRNNNENFLESDLWNIIGCCISALLYLKSNGIVYDTITPQTILISDDWEIKLAENF